MSHVKNSPGLLLHAAIEDNDFLECQRLLKEFGKTASMVKNRSGTTPLMAAANGACGRENNIRLVEALLAAGAKESAAERNKNGRTAADIAKARGALELSKRLRFLETEAAGKESFSRCKICKAKLRRRSKLEFVRDKVFRGEEANPLLVELFKGDGNSSTTIKSLSRPEFHRVNSCLALRKELSESMALISELKRLRSGCIIIQEEGNREMMHKQEVASSNATVSWKGWHIVDLCSGSSLTASLALHLLPGATITAVDMVDPGKLPHFEAAGFGQQSFRYLQSDIYDKALVGKLHERANEITHSGRITTVVFGMHCCGDLSFRAIEIFQEMKAKSIFLMPCCLPAKSGASESVEKAVYTTTNQTEQYQRWAKLLRQQVSDSGQERQIGCGSVETSLKEDLHVMSPRNALITGILNSNR